MVHAFAREQERSAEVQATLADLFNLSEAIYNLWLDQDKENWTCKIPNESANLALTLDIQACRLFRSIIEDCQRCEAFSASILARTLFETVLGVAFLVKKDVRIIVEPVFPRGSPPGTPPIKYAAKARSKGVKRTRKHLLSRELRANLYLASRYFSLEDDDIASMGKFPGFYHKAKRLRGSADPKVRAQYEKRIGPEWSSILQHGRSYAGLPVKELAAVLHRGFLRWYETVYHFQSCDVHAVDLLQHIDMSDGQSLKAAFLSSNHDVYQSLWAATGLSLMHIHLLHENIGFGSTLDSALHSHMTKFNRVASNGIRS
jgi:hypothetical protein